MDALIFIDTNILLDFYRIRSSAVGLELLSTIEKHKSLLITGSQVEMEYKKNRQRVVLQVLQAQKTPDWSGLAIPTFLSNAKPAKMIEKNKKALVTQQQKLRDRIAKILHNPSANDPVYQTLQRVFGAPSAHNLTRRKKVRFEIRELAQKRFMLGYPPRKSGDTSIGDAVNWEWIIYCAQNSTSDIILVTRDSDYGVAYHEQYFLNDWLRLEFKERVSRKRSIILTERLAEAFKLVSIKVSSDAEKEEKEFIGELSATLPCLHLEATGTTQPMPATDGATPRS